MGDKLKQTKGLPALVTHAMLQQTFKAIFAPGCWFKKAARVLGCHPGHVRNLALGKRKLTRRQRVRLLMYAEQRHAARSSYRKQAHKTLDRELDAVDNATATGILVLRAKK